MTENELDIDIGNLSQYGVLSKKEVFKWCVHVSAIHNSDSDKRSDFFSFGPSNDAKFYLLLPSTKSRLSKQPYCSTSQFSVFLCKVWQRSNKFSTQDSLERVKVSLSLLDLRDRLHHTCDRIMHDCDKVHGTFDRSCYDKYQLTFVRNGFIVIYCALDVDEVIQEDSTLKNNLQLMSLVDETSTVDLIKDFSSILENGLHSDVTLCVSGKDFQVHRAILSARSPVFAAMFQHDTLEKQQNRVVIEDVSEEAISHLLRYLYTGQTNKLSIQEALSLFVASDKYSLPKLKEKCSNSLCSNLTNDMLLNVLVIANLHEDNNLRNAAIQGILENAVHVMKSEEWLCFLKEYPMFANSIIIQLALKSQKE